MDSNFSTCYSWVRKSEGGNDDDPDDPGGRTSRGITQHEYNAYCAVQKMPQGDVWAASELSINAIYHMSYWLPYCEELPSGPDYVFFDENVNAGLHEAVLILQRALGVVADGHIGIITMNAIDKADPVRLINSMTDERKAVYKEIVRNHPRLRKYLNGWNERARECRVKALTLVGGIK